MNMWEFIYRSGWFALGILITVGVISFFVPKIKHYHELRRQEAVLAEDIRLEEQLRNHLRENQQKLPNDPRFLEKIAREEFGYVKPGETVFKFVDDEPQTRRSPP